MKRIISVLMICILLLSMTMSVSAEDINNEESTECEKIDLLLNMGFPEEIISKLDSTIVNRIYKKIQQDDVKEIISNTETFVVDMGTSENQNNRAAISSSKLRIVASTMNYANASGKITGCDVDITYDWLSAPGVCDTDVITLGWDPTLFTYSDYMSGYNKVDNISSGDEDFYNFISAAALANTGGIGWYVELTSPNISPKIQANPGGWAYISFLPAKNFYTSSGITSNFQIQYSHNKTGVSIGLSKAVVGVSVDCFGGVDTASKSLVYYSNIVNDW